MAKRRNKRSDGMKTIYKISDGLVLGKYWSEGTGYYASDFKDKEFKTARALNKFLDKSLKDGSLDSGMGYEYLTGYYILVKRIEIIKRKKKEYCNESLHIVSNGLTGEQEDIADELMSYN